MECGFTLKRVRDMTRTYSHENKYLIDEIHEKFNRTLKIPVVRNKEAFFCNRILWYLKEL